MVSSEQELWVQLQARVLAQQMFTRSVLTAIFLNTPDPLASLEEMRSAQMLAAENAARPIGPYEDEVWTKALEAFHYELNQVAARIAESRSIFGTSKPRGDLRDAATETTRRLRELQEA